MKFSQIRARLCKTPSCALARIPSSVIIKLAESSKASCRMNQTRMFTGGFMQMKKHRRKIYRSILKSTLVTSSVLLCLLLALLAYQTLTGKGAIVKMMSYADSLALAKNPAPDSPAADGRQAAESSQTGSAQPQAAGSRAVEASIKPAREASGSTRASGSTAENSDAAGETKRSTNQTAGTASKNAAGKKAGTPKKATLVFAGDVYFSDYVLANYNQSGISAVLSEPLRNELSGADITMLNNEFPYSTRGTKAPDKQFTFRIDPSYVSILKESGTDVVTLANNHVLDYGTDALTDTFQTLDDAGIAYAGAGNSLERASRLITKKAGGRTFGFLAASRVFPVVSWNVENAQPGVFSAYDPSRLTAAVSEARKKCDFLCVYVHWGIERSTQPEAYQVSMAHALIDAGADAVIGAHPHVLQGVEYYKEKPVFYSLGNFIFYQNIERTAIAKLTLKPDNTASWQLLPAKASGACTSLVSDAASRQEFYNYMEGLCVNAHFTKNGRIVPGDAPAS